jgi:hypothetical protein
MFDLGHDAVKAKLDVLDRHYEFEGCDPATIRKTIVERLHAIGQLCGGTELF